jgi:hypothetical protein
LGKPNLCPERSPALLPGATVSLPGIKNNGVTRTLPRYILKFKPIIETNKVKYVTTQIKIN